MNVRLQRRTFFRLSQFGTESFVVDRAANIQAGFVANVSINHCRGDVFVAEQFLHSANIVTVPQQMRSKTVSKSMAACGFWDAGDANGLLHCVMQVARSSLRFPSRRVGAPAPVTTPEGR
jgi:hypothetical protein